MNKYTSIILFVLILNNINPLITQSLYEKYNSETREIINDLKEKNKKYYYEIIKNRKENNLQNRIDTIDFDYLFIAEYLSTYIPDGYGGNANNGTENITITERYFNKTDSLPMFIFKNGEKINIEKKYSKKYLDLVSNTAKKKLKPLMETYSSYNRIQEYAYNKKQLMFYLKKKRRSKSWYKKERKKTIRNKYVIFTLIDKTNSKILVSIQLPAKHPKFYLNLVFLERVL